MVGLLEVGKRFHGKERETNILRVLYMYKENMSSFGTPLDKQWSFFVLKNKF